MRIRGVIIPIGLAALLFALPAEAIGQWVKAGNPKGGWVTSLLVTDAGVFAGTRKGGVRVTSDQGKSWKKAGQGIPDDADVQCLAELGTVLVAGTVNGGIFRSADRGATWTPANAGLPRGVACWRLEVVGTKTFAAIGPDGKATVYRSDDGGASWTIANAGLPETNVFCLAAFGTALLAGLGQPFSNKPGGVYISRDDGTSWQAVKKGLPDSLEILCLAVCGTDVFAGTWSSGRVGRSTDGCGTWFDCSDGLPDPLSFSLSALESDGKNVFLGSFMGVFVLPQGASAWSPMNKGMAENSSVYALAVGGTDLYAGTEEGRVWRMPLGHGSAAKPPEKARTIKP